LSFDLVIFDLDGTLVDTLPDITAALNFGLAQAGVSGLPAAAVRGLVGEGVHRLAEKALALVPPAPGVTSERLVEALAAFYREHVCAASRPYPGMEELLVRLRAHPRRRMAVLTNKPGDLARGLMSELHLDRFFDDIIGDSDGYPCKPDPAAARWLMTRHEAPPERTLVVGDGRPDLELARAIGCAAAAVTWGFVERAALLELAPDFVVDHPAQLEAVC
jgi:phosphoglycolate phosphatase